MRYAHSKGFDIRPFIIIERNWPKEVVEFPSISLLSSQYNDNEYLIGREKVLDWFNVILKPFLNFNDNTNVTTLAKEWAINNPKYRIL